MAGRNLFAEITEKMLGAMEAAKVDGKPLPWVKPWRDMPMSARHEGLAGNAVTNKPYRGINVILSWIACSANDWQTPLFATFNQVKAAGGNVIKGSKATRIYFMSKVTGKPKPGEKKEDAKSFFILREYSVFNVAQIEGVAWKTRKVKNIAGNPDERDATIDDFIGATGAIFNHNGGDKAFYSPALDAISMPAFKAFHSADSYYHTAFHELAHWTGHEKRCNREFGKRFGDSAYAAEELVAELTAAFLGAEFGINVQDNSARYLNNWIKLLSDHEKAFFQAASAAQKAADFMRAKIETEDDESHPAE